MKEKKRWGVRALATVLAVVLGAQILPLTVMAENLHEEKTEIKSGTHILGEAVEKRDVNKKVFRRADGTQTLLYSGEAMHYQSDGTWKDIDNTLTSAKNKRGEAVLKNRANTFSVELPKSMEKDKELRLEKDGQAVAFSFLPEQSMQKAGAVVKDQAKAVKSETEKAAQLKNAPSGVVYQNVTPGLDLEYVVSTDGLKENLLLKSADTVQQSYQFRIRTEHLTAQKTEQNGVSFKDSTGKIVFEIPAPVMYDAKHQISTEIDVSFQQEADGTFRMTYTPSQKWLQEKQRAYPVVLDPVIRVAGDNTRLKDTMISEPTSKNDNLSTVPYCMASVSRKDECDYSNTLYDFRTISSDLYSAQVLDAKLKLHAVAVFSGSCTVTAHRVTSDWDASTVTYQTKPTYAENAFDYFTVQNGDSKEVSLNLTGLISDWSRGVYTNYGVLLKTSDYNAAMITSNEGYAPNAPVLEVTYRPTRGMDHRLPSHSMSAVDAGTVYWNDLTGAIGIQREDISLPGEIMPVSISRVYDSNAGVNFTPYGTGWSLNYAQRLSYYDNTFTYLDEIGLERFFIKANKESEDGRELWEEAYSSDGTVLLIDKGNKDYKKYSAMEIKKADGISLRFDSYGRLVTMTDATKNKNKITIVHNGNPTLGIDNSGIKKIIDGVGRQFQFIYEVAPKGGQVLKAIECLDASGSPITFQADDGTTVPIRVDYSYENISMMNHNLIKVTPYGGQSVEYAYSANKLLLKDSSGGTVECALSNKRATKLTKKVYDGETKESLLHSSQELTRDERGHKEYKDHTGAVQIVQYDAQGSEISRRQKDGTATFTTYNEKGESSESPVISTNINLLTNGDFSSGLTGWTQPTMADGAGAVKEEYASAPKACRIYNKYDTPYWMSQTAKNAGAGTYTLSGQLKIPSGAVKSGGVSLRLSALNAKGEVIAQENSTPLSTTGSVWVPQAVSLEAPKGTASVQASIGSQNMVGEAYADDVQLVQGENEEASSRYNYIKNGDFTQTGVVNTLAKDWSNPLLGGSRTVIGADDTRDPAMDNSVFYLRGFSGANSSTCQDVQIDGKKGETFTIGAWAKGENTVPVAGKDGCFFGVQVEVKKSDGSYETIDTVDFYDGIRGWQYLGNTFSLEEDTPVIRVRLCYFRQLGNAYFDGIQLYKEDYLSPKSIDGNGLQEKKCPCHLCSEDSCTCRCASEEVCTCPQCKRYKEIVLNDNSQCINSYTTDGTKKLSEKTTYNETNNYKKTSGSPGLNMANYSYNEKTGQLLSKDEQSYSYDTKSNLSRVTSIVENSQVMSNQYRFEGNYLKSITHNDFDYNLKHNAFGNMTSLSIGNKNFITNTYTEDFSQKVQNTSYGNGQKLSYRYDSKGNLIDFSQDGGADWRFNFEYGADNLKSITDRKMQIKTELGQNTKRIYNQKTNALIYQSGFDNQGNRTEQVNGNALYTFKMANESRDIVSGKTTMSYSMLGNPISLNFTNTTDYFGRQEQKTLTYGNKGTLKYKQTVKNSYLDVQGTDETTKLIKSFEQNHSFMNAPNLDNRYDYTYNGKGDIKTISKNGVLLRTYTYGNIGELKSEVNHEQGKVYTYRYDAGGNLLSCHSGPYDPNRPTWIDEDKSYTYGDDNWKDLLTEYNGKKITYDEIGNPLAYDGWSYTWEAGRQLKSQEKDGIKIEYNYDHNGQRTQKKVTKDGETETYDYVWKDQTLLGLTKTTKTGTDSLYFFSNKDGKAAGFVHNNSEVYFYQTDAQGNVNSVIQENGTVAATYTYDAWGNLLSSSGKLAELNPLTYRGYVYDMETGYYYLQSRYYNSEWGRFLNADTVLSDKHITGFNLFAYCWNNPNTYIDTTGKSPRELTPEEGKNLIIGLFSLETLMNMFNVDTNIWSTDETEFGFIIKQFYLSKLAAKSINTVVTIVVEVGLALAVSQIYAVKKFINNMKASLAVLLSLSKFVYGIASKTISLTFLKVVAGIAASSIIDALLYTHFIQGNYALASFTFIDNIREKNPEIRYFVFLISDTGYRKYFSAHFHIKWVQ